MLASKVRMTIRTRRRRRLARLRQTSAVSRMRDMAGQVGAAREESLFATPSDHDGIAQVFGRHGWLCGKITQST
jgi:hypothetical protein